MKDHQDLAFSERGTTDIQRVFAYHTQYDGFGIGTVISSGHPADGGRTVICYRSAVSRVIKSSNGSSLVQPAISNRRKIWGYFMITNIHVSHGKIFRQPSQRSQLHVILLHYLMKCLFPSGAQPPEVRHSFADRTAGYRNDHSNHPRCPYDLKFLLVPPGTQPSLR